MAVRKSRSARDTVAFPLTSPQAAEPPAQNRAHPRVMNQLECVLNRTGQNRLPQTYPRPAVVIAIPVFNEVERIGRCVSALTKQRALSGYLLALVDPVPHDTWPRHYNASGANIALRVDALGGVDDFPPVAGSEDRLFVGQLEAHGRRVRHDTNIRARTSGRLFGRAVGGIADTLRKRIREPATPCDPRLECLDRRTFALSCVPRLVALGRILKGAVPCFCPGPIGLVSR